MKPRMQAGAAFCVRLSPPSQKPGEDDVGILTGRSSGSRIILGAAFPVSGGDQWRDGPSSTLTVAGPRGIFTPLPFLSPFGHRRILRKNQPAEVMFIKSSAPDGIVKLGNEKKLQQATAASSGAALTNRAAGFSRRRPWERATGSPLRSARVLSGHGAR
jgi:hypothetical protein